MADPWGPAQIERSAPRDLKRVIPWHDESVKDPSYGGDASVKESLRIAGPFALRHNHLQVLYGTTTCKAFACVLGL